MTREGILVGRRTMLVLGGVLAIAVPALALVSWGPRDGRVLGAMVVSALLIVIAGLLAPRRRRRAGRHRAGSTAQRGRSAFHPTRPADERLPAAARSDAPEESVAAAARTRPRDEDGQQDRPDVDRLTLVTDLRKAVTAGELHVVFQPKVRLGDRGVAGVEALVRWSHPTRGAIPPAEFIPVAEHTGLIEPLTELVLERSLTQARAWKDAGTDLSVAVNLSLRSLRDLSFPESLRQALARAGVPASSLVLEVTEQVLMADPERTLAVLDRLGALGVGLSLDDLGTGRSSLSYLRRLPVDEVKIDRSFVVGLASDPDDTAIVGTIVELGHRLGKRVVAEGVEDPETWALLRRLGCDVAQGFLICRPRPPEQVLGWLHGEWIPGGGREGSLLRT